MKYRIKIVPKTTPNADGEWRDAEAVLEADARWLDLAMALDAFVPPTHFLCSIAAVPRVDGTYGKLSTAPREYSDADMASLLRFSHWFAPKATP